MTQLLTEGSNVVLFSREGRGTHPISTATYLDVYASFEIANGTFNISPSALRRKAEEVVLERHFAREQRRFNQRMADIPKSVREREILLNMFGAGGISLGIGAMSAFAGLASGGVFWASPGLACFLSSFSSEPAALFKEIRLSWD